MIRRPQAILRDAANTRVMKVL